MRIPIDQIEIPHQLRDSPDPDHIQALAESIKHSGLLQPIIATRTPTGYRLIAGYHRLQAVKSLGHSEIEAHIVDDAPEPEKLTMQLTENITRKDMPLREQVRAIIHLHQTLNMPLQRIAQLTGRSITWIKQRINITGYPEDVQEALFTGRINLGQADILSQITDEATRRQAITHTWQMGLTTNDLKRLLDTLENYPADEQAIPHAHNETQEMAAKATPQERCALCGRIRDIVEMRPALLCMTCWGDLAEKAERQARNTGGSHDEQYAKPGH